MIGILFDIGVKRLTGSQFHTLEEVRFNDNNNKLTCLLNHERCTVCSVLISLGMKTAQWLAHLWFRDLSGNEIHFKSYIIHKYPNLNIK